MKLKINESLLIGGPKRSAKIEVDTNNKIFDIEIVSGYMSFSNTISGMSYTQINLTTTSSFNYKTWDILGTFTIKSNKYLGFCNTKEFNMVKSWTCTSIKF